MPEQRSTDNRSIVSERQVISVPPAALVRWAATAASLQSVGFVPNQSAA